MKFNIPTKVLMAFIVCFAIFAVIFFYSLKLVENQTVIDAGNMVAKGVLISLEKKLMNTSKSNWYALVNKNTEGAVKIISTDYMNLTSAQRDKLNAGEMILQTGATYQLLNMVFVKHTAYKKIGNTSHALAYTFSNPSQLVGNYLSLTIKQIVNDLQSKPKDMWGEEVPKLENIYGFPLHVYQAKSTHLPTNIIKSLSTSKLVFETDINTSRINTVYYAFGGGVLKIGPLSYLPVSGRVSDVLYYFVMAFFMITLFLIIFFVFLFVRNIRKIYQTTEQFSQGQFSFRKKIGAMSVLYGLSENINNMGDQLHRLIESKKNMSRYVAHEVRTPLYTMQLALDSMADIERLPVETNDYIASLKEDIVQLNHLVTVFLLYSQTSDHELKANKECLNLASWLKAITERYQLSNIKVTLNTTGCDDADVYFDPKLLKHAIENIIVNAVKFAKSKVIVSLQNNQEDMMISIDDDGPGIVGDDREKAFDAFATLEQSKGFGGHIGLGLSIAKSIVALHSGKIFIENSSSGGCRFVIRLPKV